MKRCIGIMMVFLFLLTGKPMHASEAYANVTLSPISDTSLRSSGYFNLTDTSGDIISSAYRLEGIHVITTNSGTAIASESFFTSGIYSNVLVAYGCTPGTYKAAVEGDAYQYYLDYLLNIYEYAIDTATFTIPVPVPPRPPEPVEDRPDDCGDSPVVIDLDGNWFQFTDVDNGVAFDIDADGIAEHISWTKAATDDAFLVLDRNANGIVDDGSELFGNHTPQPAADAPNGYEALAVYDTAAGGGNADGAITAADTVYTALQLWTDTNKNGVSEPTELTMLAHSTVESISLAYRSSRRQDRQGNQMQYLSKVSLTTGHWVWSTDVFFLVGE